MTGTVIIVITASVLWHIHLAKNLTYDAVSYLWFVDTKARRGRVTSPESHSWEDAKLKLTPCLSDSQT